MSLGPVSIVLPAYNEKDNLIELVREIKSVLVRVPKEILIVDDDSPDGTAQAIQNEFGMDPEVKIIVRKNNRGLANSIREGLEKASGNTVVIMDSDFNHQPQYLPFMIESLAFYPCVSGSRFVYGGKMESRLRHRLSWLFNIFVRLSTRGSVTDSLYGFLAIRKSTLEKLDYDKIFWGYGDYCIRLMYYLQKQGVEILQFPAENGCRKSGKGNSKFLKVFRQYFTETVKLTIRERFTCP